METAEDTLGDTADEERNTSDGETVIGGEVWDLARRLVVSPFPLALISSGVLFGLLLLGAVFAVLRLYCAGYEISSPRSSLTSTDLDSVEWGLPSGGFFRQRTSYPDSKKEEKFWGLKCYSDHDHKSRKVFRAVHLFLPCNADRPESPSPGNQVQRSL